MGTPSRRGGTKASQMRRNPRKGIETPERLHLYKQVLSELSPRSRWCSEKTGFLMKSLYFFILSILTICLYDQVDTPNHLPLKMGGLFSINERMASL